MDDDPVLRALGADLERDDPALAALLSGTAGRRRKPVVWLLPALAIVVTGLLLAPAVTFGVLSMLLVLASPLIACLWCADPGDGPVTGPT